jgi:hypothetical protein
VGRKRKIDSDEAIALNILSGVGVSKAREVVEINFL